MFHNKVKDSLCGQSFSTTLKFHHKVKVLFQKETYLLRNSKLCVCYGTLLEYGEANQLLPSNQNTLNQWWFKDGFNYVLMPGHRRRLWPRIETSLAKRFPFASYLLPLRSYPCEIHTQYVIIYVTVVSCETSYLWHLLSVLSITSCELFENIGKHFIII